MDDERKRAGTGIAVKRATAPPARLIGAVGTQGRDVLRAGRPGESPGLHPTWGRATEARRVTLGSSGQTSRRQSELTPEARRPVASFRSSPFDVHIPPTPAPSEYPHPPMHGEDHGPCRAN